MTYHCTALLTVNITTLNYLSGRIRLDLICGIFNTSRPDRWTVPISCITTDLVIKDIPPPLPSTCIPCDLLSSNEVIIPFYSVEFEFDVIPDVPTRKFVYSVIWGGNYVDGLTRLTSISSVDIPTVAFITQTVLYEFCNVITFMLQLLLSSIHLPLPPQ